MSVCHLVNPVKNSEAIEVPFALTTQVGPEKNLLHIADRFGRILYCVNLTQYILLVYASLLHIIKSSYFIVGVFYYYFLPMC